MPDTRRPFLSAASRPACLGRGGRALTALAGMIAAVMLAGCAADPHKQSAYGGRNFYDFDYANDSADPVGELVNQRYKRYAPAYTADAARRSSPLVGKALDQLGIRYQFGGSSPETGFDCSGLVNYSAEHSLGLHLPRNSAALAMEGVPVDRNALRPGDLVFFNTLGRRYSHVGIYMGDDMFVHSPSRGGVVRVEDMTASYWVKRYNGARRIDGHDATASSVAPVSMR